MNMMYRKKLILLFLIINILISFSFIIIVNNYNYTLLRDKLFLNAKNQSIQIDNYVSNLMDEIRENVEFLSKYPCVLKTDSSIKALFNMNSKVTPKKYSKNIKGLEGQIFRQLDDYRIAHKGTPFVYLGTKWGGYIQSPDGVSVDKYDPRKRPWYIAAIKKPNEVVITNPYVSYGTKEEYEMAAVKAVKDSKGNVIGVVGFDTSLASLSRTIIQLEVSNSGYAFIMLNDGTIIAHPNKKLNFQNIEVISTKGNENKNAKYVVKDYSRLLNKKNNEFETSINGKPVLINVYTSKNLDYKIVNVIEKSQLIKEANGATYYMILVALGIILASIIIIMGMTKKLTQPITELMNIMEDVGEGNLNIRSNIKSKDEFGKLGGYFNDMLDKLSSGFNELTALYEELSANQEEMQIQYEQLEYSRDKILHMAQYDSLTELPNRDYFMKKLSDDIYVCLGNKNKGAVFFIDLDNFKNINDTMGHVFGDKLLISVSDKLRKIVNGDNIIGRLGGDEFGIMYSYLSDNDIINFGRKILDIFKEPFEIDEKQIYITPSIGIAIYPEHGFDVESIIKNVDAAMYKAKESGKNKIVLYDEEISRKLERRAQIERVLRTAIDNNEFMVYYQPQYITGTKEIYGFEALIRLNSKELGFISPAEFIPIAEESGCITEIGQWVFEEACRQSHEWLEKGYKFRSMSVNVSSVQIYQADFFDKIIRTIEDIKIDVNIIELELTETVLMESIDSYINIFKRFMDNGIRIALDDFGTGYSSLNYLRKIPLSTLKVDKSFIDNIASSEKEDAIIKNIIEMAHTMDLKVVAEGVENEKQFEFLRMINCNYIQGYYLGKPLSASDAGELLASKSLIA